MAHSKSRTETTRTGDDTARPHYPWFNPHRQSKSEPLDELCANLYRLVDGYEFAVLGRKRARTVNEQENLQLLVESFVADLVYQHTFRPDDPLLVIRSNKILSRSSRYKPSYYGKKFRHVLDALAHQPPRALDSMAYIKQTLGEPDNGFKQGTTTMVHPTQRLRDEFVTRRLGAHSTGTRPGEEVIILRDSRVSGRDGEYGAFVEYPDNDETTRYRTEMRTINDYMESADFEVYEDRITRGVDPFARRMRRIFTMGGFATGGRLYGGFWQTMPRHDRDRGLAIQGEPIVTLDYGQLALRVAYSKVNAQLPEGDGYTIPGLEDYRGPVKKLINSMLFPRMAKWNLIPATIRKRLPEHMSDEQIVELVQHAHAPLLSVWWTNIGHEIQKTESDIIVDCLLQCIERDIVALQVHDALIMPQSKAEAVKAIMLETFERHTGLAGAVEAE